MNIKYVCRRLYLLLTSFVLCCAITQMSAKGESAGKWENEYKAYGRTIKVNVDISVPGKDKLPFLAIEPMNELSSEEIETFQAYFKNIDKSDKKYTFRNKKNKTIINYNSQKPHPDLENPEKVTTSARSLLEYNNDTAYAEDNALTVREAEDLIRSNIQIVFPDENFQIKDIVIYDRTKYRKSGKKIVDKGEYELYCMQLFDGIPMAGSIHNAYRYDQTIHDGVVGKYGSSHIRLSDPENFAGTYDLWSIVAELRTPDQLLSFDSIKPQIEKMIMSGNIRNIYHVYLGYAQYDLPEGGKYKYVLSPAWVIWADWLEDSTEEMDRDTVNGTGLYMEWYCYKPIIFNAITGEATDPKNINEDRMLLPTSLMNWVGDD